MIIVLLLVYVLGFVTFAGILSPDESDSFNHKILVLLMVMFWPITFLLVFMSIPINFFVNMFTRNSNGK